MKPLRQEKRPKRAAPERRPGSPREEWVLEAPEAYVIRRLIPIDARPAIAVALRDGLMHGSLSGDGWWESTKMSSLEEVAAQFAMVDPSQYLVYAMRKRGDDWNLALVPTPGA